MGEESEDIFASFTFVRASHRTIIQLCRNLRSIKCQNVIAHGSVYDLKQDSGMTEEFE